MMQKTSNQQLFTQDSGFSLIEVMVALFIFSLIAGSMTLILYQSIEEKDAIEAEIQSVRSIQKMRSVMKQDFSQMIARPASDIYGNRPRQSLWTAMSPVQDGPVHNGVVQDGALKSQNPFGDNTAQAIHLLSLSHTSRNSSITGTSPLQHSRYYLAGGHLYRHSYHHIDPAINTAPYVQRLRSNIKDAKFTFYNGTSWVNDWRLTDFTRPHYPKAIRLTLVTDIDTEIHDFSVLGGIE